MDTTFQYHLWFPLAVVFFLLTLRLHGQLARWQRLGPDWTTGTDWASAAVSGNGEAAIFNSPFIRNPNLGAFASILRVVACSGATGVGGFTFSNSATHSALTTITTQTVNSSVLFHAPCSPRLVS